MSCLRSTSNGVDNADTPIRPSTSRAFLGAPSKTDGSSDRLRLFCADLIKNEGGGYPGVATASRLPSSHLATPENALRLLLEPNPFPSELLHLDLGPAAHGVPSPRSEADFFLGQGGDSLSFLGANTRKPSRMLTRSPANISDASSQLPSPSTHSDDSLTLLPLAHRPDLNKRRIDSFLDLPALRLHESPPPFAGPPSASKPVAKLKDDSFIYKMPILRSMSPLADMSSDSEDQDSDEPLIGSSVLPDSSARSGSTSKVELGRPELPLPQEGRTGEIFVTPKTILPLALRRGCGNDTEKCVRNSADQGSEVRS